MLLLSNQNRQLLRPFWPYSRVHLTIILLLKQCLWWSIKSAQNSTRFLQIFAISFKLNLFHAAIRTCAVSNTSSIFEVSHSPVSLICCLTLWAANACMSAATLPEGKKKKSSHVSMHKQLRGDRPYLKEVMDGFFSPATKYAKVCSCSISGLGRFWDTKKLNFKERRCSDKWSEHEKVTVCDTKQGRQPVESTVSPRRLLNYTLNYIKI